MAHMRRRFVSLVLLCAAPIVGCGTSNLTSNTNGNGTSPSLSGNWQIQIGNAITSPPQSLYMLGAIQTQGSQVTGIFSDFGACLPPISTLTGTIDSSGNLTLDSGFLVTKLQVPANPQTTPAIGTLTGGGYLCQALLSGSAIGMQIAPLTGTYTGTVVAANSNPPSTTGIATLVLTQSATANATGQFPLTGTLQFASPLCTNTVAVTGTISGTGYTLASTPAGTPPVSNATVSGFDSQGGATLPATSLSFAAGPCNIGGAAFYAGTLTRQ
jgi:hypothetical protein